MAGSRGEGRGTRAASHFDMMIQANEIRREPVIMVGWVDFVVADFSDPPGNLRAIVRTTLRNRNSGSGNIA